MTIREISKLLDAEIICCEENADMNVHTACGSDMMSDVLAYVKDQSVLLPGLCNPQVIRTAEMMDMVCIVFVRGKQPTAEMLEYAWDDIKNEDGALKHGVQLVLVDVIIEGQDAVAPDMIDYDISPEYGYHRGETEFFIDRLQLVDASVTDADGLHPVKDTDFWSFYWEGAPNPVYDSVQIHPNIRQFYTFGFLIGANQQDGTYLNLSNLYLCAEEDTLQLNLIPLTSIS